MKAQEDATRAQEIQSEDTAYNQRSQAQQKQMENELLRQRLEVFMKYPWLMESEVMLGGSTAGSVFNVAKGAAGMLKNAQNAKRKLQSEVTKFGPRGEYRGGSVTTRSTK